MRAQGSGHGAQEKPAAGLPLVVADRRPKVSSFRDLVAWQKAMDLVDAVYALCRTWPAAERFGLTQQALRAAVSVPSNIAEGFERRSRTEYLRYIAIACGSLAELETHLRIAVRVGINDASSAETPLLLSAEVGRILRGIERSLGRKLGPTP